MKRIDEITRILAAHKEELRESYKVKELGIFEVPDLLDFINLERYLQRVLKKKVDLVRKPAIRKELKERILNEVVYA